MEPTLGSGSTAYPGNTSGVGWNQHFLTYKHISNITLREHAMADEYQLVPFRRRRNAERAAEPMPDIGIGHARRARPEWEHGPEGAPADRGIGRIRLRYFANPQDQNKYYGIKRMINFQRRYPLRDFWYKPVARGTFDSLSEMGASYKLASQRQRERRRQVMMSGRGKYTKGRGGFFGGLAGLLSGQGWKAGSDMGDRLWDAGGSALANHIPYLGQAVALGDKLNPLAQTVATMAGHGLYKRGRGLYRGKGLYRGRGEYVSTNGLVQGPSVVPQFGQDDMKSTIITNREFICDITAPTTNQFVVDEYQLNPGLSKLFQWLSQIAINYEEYAIKQLIVTYKSTVADFASSSGQVGQVIMATQYNPSADSFSSKEEMMLYEGGMSCKTTEHMQHGIECDPKKIAGNEYKYVRAGTLPQSEDLKEYDLGRLSLAIIGTPSTYNGQIIGELWVSYTIELRKPKVASAHAYNVKRDVYVSPQRALPASLVIATPNTVLAGARNSFNCSLVVPATATFPPASTNSDILWYTTPTPLTSTGIYAVQFTLTFPSDFNGVVKIRVIVKAHAAAVNPAMIVPISYATNTIKRFFDIPEYDASQNKTWSHMFRTRSDNEDGLTVNQILSSDFELHLRIQSPQNGLPNTIMFASDPGYTAGDVLSWRCEVVQINSFLSIQDNGSNDRLQLMNHSSGLTANWE